MDDDFIDGFAADDIYSNEPSEIGFATTEAPTPNLEIPSFGIYINPLLEDTELINGVREIISQAWLEADDDTDASCVSNHRGTRSYQLQIKYVDSFLFGLGFEREVVRGQVRFVNTTRYPFPVRFLFCGGAKDLFKNNRFF
ncbi:MAG: hypothetical protein ABIY70_25895 [Capsulimonas sp.]|uniref:hypothetical protein n=1 Tax=Capsulimonas sp. TaxID=2494211 RepID=UPI003264B4AE